jgi:hypothetical protein
MADITYNRTFEHVNWLNNVDIVDAEDPEKGFNRRFHDLEAEFDKISTVVGQINTALKKGLSINPVMVITLSKQLGPNQVTDPEEIDIYNNADFPGDVKKVYQISIEPFPNAHGQVSYNLIYEPATGNKTRVSLWFKEEKNLLTRITVRVFSLS